MAVFFAAGAAVTCAAQQPRGSVSGTVMSAAGEPLKNANVRLQATASRSNPGPAVPPEAYATTSDAQGNFRLDDLDPDRYRITVQRTGYLTASYPDSLGAPTIDLTSAASVAGITIKMTPQAVISGTITDEDGDPVPNVFVSIARWEYQNGKKRLSNRGGGAANVDGAYSIGSLEAGSYIISVQPPPNFLGPAMRQQGPQETFAATFYPGVMDASAAVAVHVTAGAVLRGTDIRMRRQRAYRIRGKVTGGNQNGVMLQLLPASGAYLTPVGLNRNASTRDGAFEIDGVLPGTYVLEVRPANLRAADGTLSLNNEMGRQIVTVGDQDVDGVVLPLGPGADVTGKITKEGTPPQQQPGQPASFPGMNIQPAVELIDRQNARIANAPGQAKPDGSFEIQHILPGAYQVEVMALPPGLYVKSIRYGGQDLTKSLLDLSSGGGGSIDVVLSYNVADISGVVHGGDGQPLADVALTLWIPGPTSNEAIDFTRATQSDGDGKFKFSDLPPGDYRVAAWEQIDSGLGTVPEFRSQFESAATSVKLSEGDHAQIEPSLIPAAEIEAAAAKTP
jgi:hypothetical protein